MPAFAIGLLVRHDARGEPVGAPDAVARARALVEGAVRAEQLGFDAWWLDVVQRPRAPAAPAVVLAAVAARTERLRLGAHVPRLADHELLRLAEDFATLDGISAGRVELLAGDEDDADRLRERVELLRRLWTESDVSWTGRVRPPLAHVTVEPRPVQQPHPPLWIRADGAPGLVDLAAELGLPLMLALAAPPRALAPLVERYRERAARAGRPARVGAWQPGAGPGGSPRTVESPAQVAEAILAARETLGLDLHVCALAPAGLEPFAREVLPLLRAC